MARVKVFDGLTLFTPFALFITQFTSSYHLRHLARSVSLG
jgi:hypothetical protein